jgi:hypothetical protein
MKKVLAAFVGTCLVAVSAVTAISPSDRAARQEAVRWVALLDAGAFKQAYEQRAPRVKGYGQEEDQWLSWMRTRRAPLGKPKSRAFYRVTRSNTLLGAPDGNYQFVIFKTSFEHKAQAAEEITLTSETGRWLVSGYHMQ